MSAGDSEQVRIEVRKAYQDEWYFPFVVFIAGSLFTLVLGAIIAVLFKWAGVPTP